MSELTVGNAFEIARPCTATSNIQAKFQDLINEIKNARAGYDGEEPAFSESAFSFMHETLPVRKNRFDL